MAWVWISDECPECRSTNFVGIDDVRDVDLASVSGIQCWRCGRVWSLDSETPVDESQCYVGRRLEVVSDPVSAGTK